MARTLLNIDPNGGLKGNFGLITGPGENMDERIKGFRSALKDQRTVWELAVDSPRDGIGEYEIALQHMYEYANNSEVQAVIPMGSWAMQNESGWKEFVEAGGKRLTMIVADASEGHVDLCQSCVANDGYECVPYCNGLVGQDPLNMGALSIKLYLKYVPNLHTLCRILLNMALI